MKRSLDLSERNYSEVNLHGATYRVHNAETLTLRDERTRERMEPVFTAAFEGDADAELEMIAFYFVDPLPDDIDISDYERAAIIGFLATGSEQSQLDGLRQHGEIAIHV